ncbi:MAG: bifunctional D-glycero-beta-D-manno-heptose-7-phosphate kinase/D-glycero-beta-D-manno-heptose 1-phosphate adenylyltransferase HldE [Gammaproteobacteria bacterium]|nr:bifunctional D-glycero-beta-D-manno-heptose-7-phosphate kinase/D-glycero-beta-D-manno-heptose 1-phosphate adenylyltransferase HldE [Gammaproteobacteria bacterium]
MSSHLPDFASARVLVVGDVMLDRYWYGATSRISPEAPVPVVHVQDVEDRPGGAANVALNAASLGAAVTLVGVTGGDEAADTLAALVAARGVDARLERRPGRPTVTKLRVLSRHQQLIRLDFEEPGGGSALAAPGEALSDLLSAAAVTVLSDYGKGTLADPGALIAAARALGRAVIVDPKGCDFTRYRGATVVTPNLTELEAVVGVCKDLAELVARGERLRGELALEALLVTRSEHGMTLLREGRAPLHLPARAREVYDVTGAGDTVVGVLAAAIAAGSELEEATALANLAAGLVVARLGTATVTAPELAAALAPTVPPGGGVADERALIGQVAAARARGERVVMTNGCFDILHAGHVRYLTEARGLGDRLLVAVNDDDSVRRLKGRDRPINPLDRRMAVLAALACVDWVVPFAEDTPERLICALGPDVLVKGGDYRPEAIAGSECVRARGGQVVVLGYLPGCSTSELIETILGSSPRRREGS